MKLRSSFQIIANELFRYAVQCFFQSIFFIIDPKYVNVYSLVYTEHRKAGSVRIFTHVP